MIKALYEKLLSKSTPQKETNQYEDVLTSEDEAILLDDTIKYKDVSIGLPHNPTKRKKDNAEAKLLMDEIQADGRTPTDEEKKILAKYTGNGGLGGLGSEDEYYTPDWVAQGTWEMLGDLPKGANVLDPSAGMGIFGRNRPKDINLTQIELDQTSSTLNQMITDLPMIQGTFQEQSYKIENNSLDGIVTNVPFAKVEDIGDDNYKGIKRLEQYFILRSMELLKPSKKAIFIVPTGIMDNTSQIEYKDKILDMASFIGGIRLPNKIFSHTGADVAVDILVFEKHREDVGQAIKNNYVSLDSRMKTIIGDENNHAFYYGNYFSTIGKKYVVGKFITSKEFSESHFLGQTAHPKSTVITKLSIDEIKEKVAQLSKTKFKNTVKYDDIKLLGNTSILDKLALERISKNEEFKAYFKAFDIALYEKRKTTIKELELFYKNYKEYAELSSNAQLPITFRNRNLLYLTIMAINYYKGKINKVTMNMLNALIFANFARTVRDKKEDKYYSKFNDELSRLIENSYAKKFKEKEDYHDKKRINENIAIIIAELSTKLMSNWDFKKNKPIEKLEFKKFKTIEDVIQDKGLRLAEEFEVGGYNAKALTPSEILEVNDAFLAQDGKLIPSSWIVYQGAKYKDAINHLNTLKYSDDYGLTEDEFSEKIGKMKEHIEAHKNTVSLDSISINSRSISTLISEKDMPMAINIARDVAESLPLCYIKSENIVKTRPITKSRFEQAEDGKQVEIKTIEEVESVEFPASMSISIFYAKNWKSQFKILWERHEEAIKDALDVKSYQDAEMLYEMRKENYDKLGKDSQVALDFYGLLKPIIMKDIIHYKNSFDIQIDTKMKLNPVISSRIKQSLDERATIDIIPDNKHESISSLKGYVSDSVIESNHGYQNEDIRHFSTTLKGVIGQDTGLGKTRTIFMSALLAVVTNRVKRALVVVPTSVYDKWVMEIKDGRIDKKTKEIVADPILTESGKSLVAYTKSSSSKADWSKFISNEEQRIMLMPHSVFETFIFSEKTLKKIYGTTQDEERANRDNEDFVSYPSRLPDFSFRDWSYVAKNPNNTIGYFEDGGIELIVIDEGQMAKNSSTGGKSIKFASSIQSSRYGVVLRTTQAIINNDVFNGTGQGVVVATATPFTSSPYEIYTMLKNTGGLENIEDFQDFEKSFMVVAERAEQMATDPDKTRLVKVFEGLDNLPILRQQGLANIIYRNAEDESKREVNGNLKDGALKPKKDTFMENLEETDDIRESRALMIEKNTLFKEFKKDVLDKGLLNLPKDRLDGNALSMIANYKASIQNKYGLDITDSVQRLEVSRKASTFSLIHGLNMLAINKDMAMRDTVVFNVSEVKKETLEKLTAKLLKTDVTYKDVESYYDKDGDKCEKEVTVKVKMDDFLKMRGLTLVEDGILSIPSVDENVVKMVLGMIGDNAQLLNIEDYPKYKGVLENITKELKANPKAKQLIFSVSKIGARVIKYFVDHLFSELEISPNKIMTALDVKEGKAKKGDNAEQDLGALAQFQEDYNNSNMATVLIFTTKNSTGVDFNKMTKAIHLVDIPYTPDVWHQAEGRGVRQGNKVDKVHVYQYSASGTLDTMKKVLLSEKGSWQEDIKDSNMSNSLSSIQVDGKKLIEEVMSKNPNATEEDIKALIAEKQSEREEIVKQEREIKQDAIKSSLTEAKKLVEILDNNDTRTNLKFMDDFHDFKGSPKSVDIFDDKTSGQSVLKNIKTNGYKAVQKFISKYMSDDVLLSEEDIHEKLDEITLDGAWLQDNRASDYLLKMAHSTQYDKRRTYYEVSGSYTRTKIIALEDNEAETKRSAGYRVKEVSLFTDNQYQDANMILEEYLEKAKDSVLTKIISIQKAESIFKDALKNVIGVVDEDEKEIYKGVLSGTHVFTVDDEVLKIEDTLVLFKQNHERFVEIAPSKLLSLSYGARVEDKENTHIKLGRVSKDRSDVVDAIQKYTKRLEAEKEKLENSKDKIEKYFNTSLEAPEFNEHTFKGISTVAEYYEVLGLITDFKQYDNFVLNFGTLNEDTFLIFKNLKDEVASYNNDTIALIDGVLLYTSKYNYTRAGAEVSSNPIDDYYRTIGESEYLKTEKLNEYNYSFIQRFVDMELKDVKELVSASMDSFRESSGVVYPKWKMSSIISEYEREKENVKIKQKIAEDVASGNLSDKSFSEVKDLINGSDSNTIREIIHSIEKQEYADADLKNLGELLQLAKDGKIARYNNHSNESQPIGIHLSSDLQVVVTNGQPINDFKNSRGRGAWAEVGIKYSKNPQTVYELDGTSKEYSNTWEIEASEENVSKAKVM